MFVSISEMWTLVEAGDVILIQRITDGTFIVKILF